MYPLCINFVVSSFLILENVNHHAAQYDPTDMPTETIPQQVQSSNTAAQKSTDDCLNVDASTASKSKPPTLDDYPDFTMTQIIALDPILNATTTPNLRTRNKNHINTIAVIYVLLQ
uniref:Uncharacterized protein n=1 Tax=Solanum lycopersicum TaxID=4081 RepID=A0A3Q7ID52_SOLLC